LTLRMTNANRAAIRKAGLVPLALVCALLVGALSLRVMLAELGQPFAGLLAVATNAGVRVDNGTPPWWPAMADITPFDTVQTAPNTDAFHALVMAATARGESHIDVQVTAASGISRSVRLPLQPFTLGHALDVRAIEILNGLTLWLIGVLILRARPADAFNRSVALACALFSMNQWLWHGALLSSAPAGSALLVIAWSIVTPLVGPALITFGLRAVQRDPSAPLVGAPRIVSASYWIVALLVLIASAAALTTGAVVDPLWIYRANILLTFGGAFGVLALLLISVLSGDGRGRTVNQRRLIAAGFLIASPALVTHLTMLWRGFGSFFVFGGLDIRVLYLAVPIMLSVAILRYQTFKSESRAQLLLANLAAAGAIGSLGDWLIRGLLTTRAAFALPPFVVIFGLVAALMLVIELLRRRGLRRVFRWQSTNTRAVRQFGERLAGQNDIATLPAHIVAGLVDELGLECAALWLADEGAVSALRLAAHAPSRIAAPDLSRIADADLLRAVCAHPEVPMRIAELPSAGGFEALVGLGAAGLLAIGKRSDEEIFHESDFEIIELIAQQSSLLIANARQVDVLRAVPARVAAAQERERSRIAGELHDTIQQFLGRLPFLLETGRALIRAAPDRADAQLARVIDDVQGAARTVREIRADLAPVQLQGGMRAPLLDLITRFGERADAVVAHDIDPAIDTALSLATRHALFRVAQQALDNIAAHAHAARVDIAIGVDHNAARVVFAIRDDGQGFEAGRPERAAAEGHLGAQSMHARIAAVGGQMTLHSAPGAGVRVEGWVPVAD
jgi:signal transduction histidine kinase